MRVNRFQGIVLASLVLFLGVTAWVISGNRSAAWDTSQLYVPVPTSEIEIPPPPPPPMPRYVSGEAEVPVEINSHKCHVMSFSPGDGRYPFQVSLYCKPADGNVALDLFELVDAEGKTYAPLASSQPARAGNPGIDLHFDVPATEKTLFLRYKPINKQVPLVGETPPVLDLRQ